MPATIHVFEPCACESCAAGGRWFQCLDPKPIASYDCPDVFDGIEDAPSAASVVHVERQHPGKMLVYSCIGSCHARAIEAARRD